VELRCHVSCLFFDVRFLSLPFDITCIGIWTAACIAFLFVAFVETLSLQQHFTGVYGDLLTPLSYLGTNDRMVYDWITHIWNDTTSLERIMTRAC
jgi:hypothetical protein